MNAIASSIREGGTKTNALMNLLTYLVFNYLKKKNKNDLGPPPLHNTQKQYF
jgi:hypothetical protein